MQAPLRIGCVKTRSQNESSVLRECDAVGCLRSLRARAALDGVSWVRSGSVEIAVGRQTTACYRIGAVICSLPRASLRSGARFGLLSGWRAARLCRFELSAVSKHCVHDDGEATCECNPCFAHRGALGDGERPVFELQ
jgi:hypothetical protein